MTGSFKTAFQTGLVVLGMVFSWASLGWVLMGADPESVVFFAFASTGLVCAIAGFMTDREGHMLTRWTALFSVALIAGAAMLAYLLYVAAK